MARVLKDSFNPTENDRECFTFSVIFFDKHSFLRRRCSEIDPANALTLLIII